MNYLWDTNIAIYYLQKQVPKEVEEFIEKITVGKNFGISVISEIELMCWKSSEPKDLEILQMFIQDCHVFELTLEIKQKTADIRKVHRIKLPDAIIAATSIVYDLTLLSRNSDDFKNIGELKIVNPFHIV
jgi:predicted nucleic acid-binding protein